MTRLIVLLLLIIFVCGSKKYGNMMIKIAKDIKTEIQKASNQSVKSISNYLLDSKISESKIVFLSSPFLEQCFPLDQIDQIIHLTILDLGRSKTLIFNDFLTISPFHPYSSGTCFFISKILNVNPLIIYINSSLII